MKTGFTSKALSCLLFAVRHLKEPRRDDNDDRSRG